MYTLNLNNNQAVALHSLVFRNKFTYIKLAEQALRDNDRILYELYAESHKALVEVEIMLEKLFDEYEEDRDIEI